MGIPTVDRERGYYLIDTLQSLVNNLDKKDWNEVVIVVFVADFKPGFLNKVVNDVKSNFSEETRAGLIQVPKFYLLILFLFEIIFFARFVQLFINYKFVSKLNRYVLCFVLI